MRTEGAKKPVLYLAGFVVLCGIGLLLIPTGQRSSVTLVFAGFETNAAGVQSAAYELQNEADACTLEPRLLIVTEEEYTNIVPKPIGGFMTSFTEDGKVSYYLAKDFAPTNTPIKSSRGNTLKRGEVTTFSFPTPLPNQGWRLLIDCWRVSPPKQTLGTKLADMNRWANRKLGVPLVFATRDWSHHQVTTAAIPARAIEQGEMPTHLKRMESHPD